MITNHGKDSQCSRYHKYDHMITTVADVHLPTLVNTKHTLLTAIINQRLPGATTLTQNGGHCLLYL